MRWCVKPVWQRGGAANRCGGPANVGEMVGFDASAACRPGQDVELPGNGKRRRDSPKQGGTAVGRPLAGVWRRGGGTGSRRCWRARQDAGVCRGPRLEKKNEPSTFDLLVALRVISRFSVGRNAGKSGGRADSVLRLENLLG
jgi:hypothetical protein